MQCPQVMTVQPWFSKKKPGALKNRVRNARKQGITFDFLVLRAKDDALQEAQTGRG
jgi:hypothetical protein